MPDDSEDTSTPRLETRLRRAAHKLAEVWRQEPWRLNVLVALNIVVIGIAALLTLWISNEWIAAGGVTGALIPMAVALIQLVRNSESMWPPLILLGVPIGVLILGLVALPAYWYVQSRAIDVSGQVELTNTTSMSDGDTAAVAIPVIESRPRLAITFHLEDNDPEEGVCAPSSELSVAPEIGALRNSSRHVSTDQLDQSLNFPLDEGVSEISLQIVLTAEEGCELDLSVSDAQLVN